MSEKKAFAAARTSLIRKVFLKQILIKYMKRFYIFYSEKLHQLGAESGICHQLGDELEKSLFVIPWRHHVEMMKTNFLQKSRLTKWDKSHKIFFGVVQ